MSNSIHIFCVDVACICWAVSHFRVRDGWLGWSGGSWVSVGVGLAGRLE